MNEKDIFIKSFEEKLKTKLSSKELNSIKNTESLSEDVKSSDYETFKIEMFSKALGRYEKLCNFFEKILNVDADTKTKPKIEKELYESHLNCTTKGVMSFSIGTSLFILLLGVLIYLFNSTFGVGIILLGIGAYFVTQNFPSLISKKIRSQSQDQIILSVFYIVAFMRFSSNFERAIHFAANYLPNPLALDFKRVLWEIQNSKYPNIKKALDKYLEKYREDNLEFLESIYLIESSLFESDEFRRISLLDKALDLILQSNYEKMIHFSQLLREKISTFNMIGVILPILGLIILPLAASMSNPKSVFNVIFLLYDVLIPIVVFYFAYLITISKPSSFNSIDVKKVDKKIDYEIKITKDFKIKVPLKSFCIFVFISLFTIGLLPIIIHNAFPFEEGSFSCLNVFEESTNSIMLNTYESIPVLHNLQVYKTISPEGAESYCYGPYGLIPAILSLFIPLSFAFSYGFYLKYKYSFLIHLRDDTKKLEQQFPSALFQLGNMINEGISSELAFGRVASTMKNTAAGDFFSKIDTNIKFLGLNVENSIFDKDKGAINNYPSELVLSSMKIFVRAQTKGPEILAKTLIDLSKYLTQIHMGQERMKDLISESVGSMKSLASFLAPLISAVVVSIVYLITFILQELSKTTQSLGESQADVAAANIEIDGILSDSIPTFFFQASVGTYIAILVVLLVYIVNNLENGDDEINRRYETGVRLISAMTKYSLICFIAMLGFGVIGGKIALQAIS